MALSHLTEQLPRCSQPCLFTSVQKNTFLLLRVLQGQLSKVFYDSYINGIVKQFSVAVAALQPHLQIKLHIKNVQSVPCQWVSTVVI